MDKHTAPTAPTYGELRLQLAKERLAHAQTLAAYSLLHASTRGALAAPALPGPRWHGAAH